MNRPEEAVQKAGLDMIRLLYPIGIPFHIPNQRFGKYLRIILAALGVLPGIPDVGVLRPYGRIGWIEFKAKKGRLTDSQKNLHPLMAALWHHVHVVDDIDLIQPILRAWKQEDEATRVALGED